MADNSPQMDDSKVNSLLDSPASKAEEDTDPLPLTWTWTPSTPPQDWATARPQAWANHQGHLKRVQTLTALQQG